MRKLNRKDFKRIHDVACGDWKEKLINWYGSKFAIEDTIEIKNSEYQTMRNACDTQQNELFDEIFGKDLDITDKIKTVDDAIKLLGEEDPEVIELHLLRKVGSKNLSFQSLVVVIKALNQGWKPDWNNSSEYKYYPWFDMSGDKPSYGLSLCGSSISLVASRLCLRSEKLSSYCAEQFEYLHINYMS